LITVGGPPGSGYVQGDPLAGDPNWMANLWTTYKLPQAHLAGWKVGVGANWRDASSWPGATNIGSALTTPAYWVCSAMASYERLMGSAKVSFQLNIENLFNHFYYYDLYPVASSNYVDLNYSTPRSVTAALKVAF
jgi:iron complex outermembrane receptor protein